MPSPRENSALWDYVVIGKTTLPPAGVFGHVKVSTTGKIKDDKKSPAGANGGRTTTQGLDLAEVDIDLEFPDAPGQHDLVKAAIDEIWPPRTEAQGIAHGSTDEIGVRDVQILSVKSTDWQDGKGRIAIKAREWRPDAKSGGGAGGGSLTFTAASRKAREAELAAAQAKLAAAKAKNIQDAGEIAALQQQIAGLQSLLADPGTATNTPGSSDPTKQWSQGGGVPLGEIQPGDRVPLGEVQP